MRWGAHEVVERESDSLDLGISPVEEVRNSELVRLVDVLGPANGVDHGPRDDIRVDDDEVELRGVRFHEFPCGCFGSDLGYVVAEDSVVFLDGLLGRDLFHVSSIILLGAESWGLFRVGRARTGFQSFSV